ncbi:hypothetical protein D3C77_728020 [compost metagenome]
MVIIATAYICELLAYDVRQCFETLRFPQLLLVDVIPSDEVSINADASYRCMIDYFEVVSAELLEDDRLVACDLRC